jgi:hypothetical protein
LKQIPPPVPCSYFSAAKELEVHVFFPAIVVKSPKHARVLCDRDSIAYTIPFVYWVPTLSLAMDKLLDSPFFKIS